MNSIYLFYYFIKLVVVCNCIFLVYKILWLYVLYLGVGFFFINLFMLIVFGIFDFFYFIFLLFICLDLVYKFCVG